MTDEFEDRLRRHLADRAGAVQADPDPTAFVDRSVGRSRPPGLVAGGVAALTVLVAGAGVLTGVNLAGAGSTASAPPTTDLGGRAGAALAPGRAGGSLAPSIVVPMAYTALFTRDTASGVAIRAYSAGSDTGGACPPTAACSPSSTLPCPTGAMCAEPTVTPHAVGGPAGTAATSGLPTVAPSGTTVGPGASGQAGGSGDGSTPPVSSASCGQLVIELSSDRAVGTGTTVLPTAPPAATDPVEVLGSGSFGLAEGGPVSWVAVWVGSGVGEVQLSVGGATVDAMAPHGGLVVLAAPGASGLVAASVVGLDPGGATVAIVPAQPGAPAAGADICTPTPVTPPPGPTPTTTPPTPTPGPTPTTTTPTTPVPTTTTATTTPPGAPVSVPGRNLPPAPGPPTTNGG